MSALVMAGLVPAIHVFSASNKDVDPRDKRGHHCATGMQVAPWLRE